MTRWTTPERRLAVLVLTLSGADAASIAHLTATTIEWVEDVQSEVRDLYPGEISMRLVDVEREVREELADYEAALSRVMLRIRLHYPVRSLPGEITAMDLAA